MSEDDELDLDNRWNQEFAGRVRDLAWGTWRRANGDLIAVATMTDDHLRNTVLLLERRGVPVPQWLRNEQQYRLAGGVRVEPQATPAPPATLRSRWLSLRQGSP